MFEINQDVFKYKNPNNYILVETNKPIVVIQQRGDKYCLVYLTQDTSFRRKGKLLHFSEFFGGYIDQEDMICFLNNKVDIESTCQKLESKSRVVKINHKIYPREEILDFELVKEVIPSSDVYLKDLPSASEVGKTIMNLISQVEDNFKFIKDTTVEVCKFIQNDVMESTFSKNIKYYEKNKKVTFEIKNSKRGVTIENEYKKNYSRRYQNN